MPDDRRRKGSSSGSSSERSLPLSQEEVDALLAGATAASSDPAPAEDTSPPPAPPEADAETEPAGVEPAAVEAAADVPPVEAGGAGEAPDVTAPDPVSEAAALDDAARRDGDDTATSGTDGSAPLTAEAIARLFAEAQEQTAPAPAKDPGVAAATPDRPARFANAGGPPVAPREVHDAAGESVGGRDLLADVILTISAEIGRSEMTIEEILKLGPGSLIELDKLAGDPVELLVNDHTIARGEVVVVDDSFGVRIIELGE